MIPYDATQHIQGIAQGVQNAMPGIEAGIKSKQAGSPTLERYIREFEERVARGEHPKSVSDDLTSQFEHDIRNGVQHTDVNVPDVGFNNGVPTVGAPGSLNQPLAQGPNSFAQPASTTQGSFNGLTPPPAAMGGGISGNASSAGGAMSPPTPAIPPITTQPPQPTAQPGTTPTDASTAANSPTGTIVKMPDEQPIPYEDKPKIDLTAGRNNMQTANNPDQPTYSIRSRGEQDQAMADIERVKKLENADGGLEFKRDKLEAESKIKILKAMANRLSDQEKNEIKRVLGEEGMSLRAKTDVMNAYIRMKNAEDMNKTRQEGNRIKANKASDKIPPVVQHLWTRYKAAADEIARYNTSLVAGSNGNPERVKQLKMVAANELHEYNKAAIQAGLPERTAQDLKVPEVYGNNDPNNKVEEE